MIGNVAEWLQTGDEMTREITGASYLSSPARVDPLDRSQAPGWHLSDQVGFRCVTILDDPEPGAEHDPPQPVTGDRNGQPCVR